MGSLIGSALRTRLSFSIGLKIDCLPSIFGCLTNAWSSVCSLSWPGVLVCSIETNLVLVETELEVQINLIISLVRVWWLTRASVGSATRICWAAICCCCCGWGEEISLSTCLIVGCLVHPDMHLVGWLFNWLSKIHDKIIVDCVLVRGDRLFILTQLHEVYTSTLRFPVWTAWADWCRHCVVIHFRFLCILILMASTSLESCSTTIICLTISGGRLVVNSVSDFLLGVWNSHSLVHAFFSYKLASWWFNCT